MTDLAEYDDAPAILTLAALLPGGLAGLGDDVAEALGQGDLSLALKAANARYASTQGRDLPAALTYAILLTHRELVGEALGVIRKGLEYNAHDVALQLAQIDALFARGDYEPAVALMSALRAVTITDARHWAYLGDMFWDLEERADAQVAYEEATRCGSDDADVAIRLADLYAEQERFWEAAEQFERAGRLAPSDAQVWAAVAEAWMGLQAWERAVHAARRTTKLAPDEPRAWAILGAAQRESGELGEALKAFERARNLDPMDPMQWLNLGALQLELGLPEEARQAYQRAADLDTSDIEALNGLVAAAYELGDVELAARLGRRALDVAPEDADALHNYGVVALSLHDAAGALDAFERALVGDPENAHLLAGKATALLLLGKVDDAVAAAEEALQRDPTDAELVLEFAQFLFRHAGADAVLAFVARAPCVDPVWVVVTPVLQYLAHALRREGDLDEDVARLVTAITENPEAIPVDWDFDELERLSFALDDAPQERFRCMLAVLDGRREVDSLRELAA